jgi:hypothetical protein
MDRGTDGRMDSQIDGYTDRWIVGYMNGWLDEIDLQANNKFFNYAELLFSFLKGITGALAPFSFLVFM